MSVQDSTQQQDTTTQTSAGDDQAQQQANQAAAEEGQNQQQDANADEQQQDQQRDDKGRFKGVQPRIDELTRARREAEREAAYWRNVANSGAGSAEQAANQKPTREQFGDDSDAFTEALTDWKAKQAVSQALQQQAQAKQQETRATSFEARQAEARTKMPDYDDVVGSSNTPLAPHVQESILESDQGPALAYHFARNPDVLMRLNGMSPTAAAREVGRLEASLASAPAAPPVKTTTAPKPANTSSGQGRNVTNDPSRMSMDEYVAHRKTQGARWAR